MSWKFALSKYIKTPEKFKQGLTNEEHSVVFYDDNVVIIEDGFPKSQCHLLILPRDPILTLKLPNEILTEEVKEKIELSKHIEWCRNFIYDKFNEKFNIIDDELNDEDYFMDNFIKCGVHSVPSMSNLHVHVISKDFKSDRMKHKKHYLSFNSNFLLNIDQLPKIVDKRESESLLKGNMHCCYCDVNYKNKFAELKRHLDVEFDKRFEKK